MEPCSRGFHIHCYTRVRVRHCVWGNYFLRNSFSHVAELVVDVTTSPHRRTDFREAFARGLRRDLRRFASTSHPACLCQIATQLLVEDSPEESVKFGRLVESRRSRRILRISLNSEGFNEFDGFNNPVAFVEFERFVEVIAFAEFVTFRQTQRLLTNSATFTGLFARSQIAALGRIAEFGRNVEVCRTAEFSGMQRIGRIQQILTH